MDEERFDGVDRECMTRAIAAATRVRCITAPNPWVGCVIRDASGELYEGATQEPGGNHAEIEALVAAGDSARGATAYVTLEPCSHTGRTGPCVDALVEAGIARVVVAIEDPDPKVAGSGLAGLHAAGVTVDAGLFSERVRSQLAPYIKHRRTGRPWVVLKLAATLDGGTAAPDGTSQWITAAPARADGHRLRAESDAILVGSGTVRRDDPSLTVRDYRPPVMPASGSVDPIRIILGAAEPEANVHPCREVKGELGAILDELGSDGIIQLLVEGGATVAGAFHRAGLVDRYVIYVAPALFGGHDAHSLFAGQGAYSMSDLWRGRFTSIERVGDDVRIELMPAGARRGVGLMFTGIVEELGTVVDRRGPRLRIGARTVLEGAQLGDSTAVNGCCLTIVAFDTSEGWWDADVSDETYARTSLGTLCAGDVVNLERPVRLMDRLGGHLVQGHVDAVGAVVVPAPDLRVRIPEQLLRYVVEKGSITVDGVSLTVVEALDDGFTVALIPHTMAVTTMGVRGEGDPVNIEVDVMAKYAEKLLAGHAPAVAQEATTP